MIILLQKTNLELKYDIVIWFLSLLNNYYLSGTILVRTEKLQCTTCIQTDNQHILSSDKLRGLWEEILVQFGSLG